MPLFPTWRVRVMKKIEDWVDVSAATAFEAEVEALRVPNVLSVFGKSAIPADRPTDDALSEGVRED